MVWKKASIHEDAGFQVEWNTIKSTGMRRRSLPGRRTLRDRRDGVNFRHRPLWKGGGDFCGWQTVKLYVGPRLEVPDQGDVGFARPDLRG
jgi:hypothetical protein